MIEIILVISRDMQLTAINQNPLNGIEEVNGNGAAPMMPALRPRIREKDVHCLDAAARNDLCHGVNRVDAQHPHIPESCSFAANAPYPTGQAFDSEIVALRILSSECEQKRAVAAADIDFDRSVAPEDLGEIQRLFDRRRHELNHCLAFVQSGATVHVTLKRQRRTAV